MIGSVIVVGSLVLAAAFCLAWLLYPEMRAWLERPKYRFQANVRKYDQQERDHEHG